MYWVQWSLSRTHAHEAVGPSARILPYTPYSREALEDGDTDC